MVPDLLDYARALIGGDYHSPSVDALSLVRCAEIRMCSSTRCFPNFPGLRTAAEKGQLLQGSTLRFGAPAIL